MAVLGYLLYPYDVELSGEVDSSDLVICRGAYSDSSKPLVRVSTRSDWRGGYQESKHFGNGVVDLPFDLISTCSKKFEAVMNPKISLTYELLTSLPFEYNIVPSWIRSLLLKRQEVDSNLSHHLTNEVARKTLINAFALLGLDLKRKNPPSLLITHDVDTERGLRRALSLKAVEDDLSVQSMWFLPSHGYPINRDTARELADGSTIGSHDVKHDGKLIHIRRHEELVQRVRESRLKLEDAFGKEVTRFRSPLLQFSRRIASALSEAGYKVDFSVPCWEPVHPTTMSGFGVESAQAFEVDGVIEIPLTLFQDHQVLNILRMNTREAIKFWVEQAKLVHSLDGDVVLLVHPDYGFSGDLQEYRQLLASLLELQAGSSQ